MHASNDTVITIRDLGVRVGRKDILRDVSFSVRRGQYLTVIGPNGAGKTTLLKCLDRIVGRWAGRIEVCGRALEDYRQRDLARLLSYVPQADGRGLPFTAEQFVLMGRYPYLSPFASITRHDRQVVQEVLQRTRTAEFAGRMLQTLSGGERQRVYIAAALAQQSEILLLEEPTTFLDYRHQAEIRELLAAVNRRSGVTIVAVTHDVNPAVLESDQVVALREGAVVFCGPPCELMRPDVLREIYGTEFLLVEHPHTRLPMVVPRVMGL